MEYFIGNWRISKKVFGDKPYKQYQRNPNTGALHLVDMPPEPYEHWTAEINTPAGYVWPDCAYKCKHCHKCLGCIRKLLFTQIDDTDDIHIVDKEDVSCSNSPTGFHEV